MCALASCHTTNTEGDATRASPKYTWQTPSSSHRDAIATIRRYISCELFVNRILIASTKKISLDVSIWMCLPSTYILHVSDSESIDYLSVHEQSMHSIQCDRCCFLISLFGAPNLKSSQIPAASIKHHCILSLYLSPYPDSLAIIPISHYQSLHSNDLVVNNLHICWL